MALTKLTFSKPPKALVILVLVLAVAAESPAQQATASGEQAERTSTSSVQAASEPASYKTVHQDEDWSYLKDSVRRTDSFDRLKYLPLRNQDDWYVSLGADIRERYELLDHPSWGQGPTDTNGYLLQRYLMHADIHLGPRLRFFTEIQSSFENGRNGGPRPADKDTADIHQAFVDLMLGGKQHSSLTFRLGRQELAFGTSRLVSIREGPNVRQTFDGLRATLNVRLWRIDGFVTKPVETNQGAFDDSPDHTRTFWGVYAVRPWKVLPNGHVDLYYLGIDRLNASFDQGSARETRHSVGARLWGGRTPWDYNYEGVFQWGSFGSSGIRAWTLASDNGYTLSHVRFRPRLGLKADVTSGDRDRTNPSLQTFNALFPKGNYFGEIALIGPGNHIDLQPSVDLTMTKKWTLILESGSFWRQSIHDGIYGPAINLLRSAGSSRSRFTGNQLALQAEWEISRHFSWVGNYTHFFPGQFIKDTGPADDVNFFATWIAFRF